MASFFSDAIGSLGQLVERNDDDIFDRLSHRWTAGVFMIAVILVSTGQLVGETIQCWVPKHFTGGWTKYTNSYCWVRNTYYLPFDEEIDSDPDQRRENPVIYYQWVPLILMLQGLFFYMPIVVWRNLNSRTGIDVNDIVETAEKVAAQNDPEERVHILYLLRVQMHRYLGINKNKTKYGLCSEGCKLNLSFITHHICGPHKGNYMTLLYILIKIVFLANAVGQLWLTNYFLGPWEYQFYGFTVLKAMYYGEDWTQSPRFPRITMCDFDIRRLGNSHKYTVQCVLPINLFNEKIYLFIWFWIVMVGFLTAVGLILWVCRLFCCADETTYVRKYLKKYKVSDDIDKQDPLYDDDDQGDRKMMRRFLDEYLRMDGLLVVRLIDYNTDKMTMQDFLSSLYEHWLNLPYVHRDEELKKLTA